MSVRNSDAARLARLILTISDSTSRGRPVSACRVQESSTSAVASANSGPYRSSWWRRNGGWAIRRERTQSAPSAPTRPSPTIARSRLRTNGGRG
jgi:hypothetical protein